MVVVVMRQCEISNVGRLIARFGQLSLKGFLNGGSKARCSAGLDHCVRDDAGVPEKGPARMHDQIRRDGHIGDGHAMLEQRDRVSALEKPAIEDVESYWLVPSTTRREND